VNRLGLLLAQAAAFWPVAHWYAASTRSASPERWQLVALAACALFVLARLDRPRESRSLAGPACLLLVYALAQHRLPSLAAGLLAVLSLTWTASLLYTSRRLHAGLLGLGLLALPVVPLFQAHLGFPLRLVTARASSGMLRFAGFDVEARGTCLDWGGALVQVDGPCSGLAMLWTTWLVTCVAATLWRLGNAGTLAGILLASLLVVAANALRACALLFVESGQVALPAWGHAGVGLVVQALVAGSVLAFLHSRSRVPCAPSVST